MICQHLLLIHRRIRVARESAIGGQCRAAHRLMRTAGRDLARARADGAITTNPCAQALAKSVGQFLAASRRQVRENCSPPRGQE